ncbi:MAG TPA: hypothetical protein VGN82_17590 [Bosea sp. (in: a-proteobacteria)]|jgi:hypothetical protein|uniref:hypothetical protein n=1 Tax=Bosea sp. (in: a-proteobacteria) TaxID=1871050 RepID=UPI002E1314D9|nr:hypothetical protein [Bosea sp. (in: a-proteobacteria)]
MKHARCFELAAAVGLLAFAAAPVAAQTAAMTFFVTSTGSGKGADLGGLAGADAICQRLAQAAGAGGKTWRAYLSTQAADGATAVNAKDRIGAGPWQNVKGVIIATSVADLHGAAPNLTKQTALTEKGEPVNGRGDSPNLHDMLTGSQADGTAFGPGEDRTCGNYTKSGAEGSVMVGHHDRSGLDDSAAAKSWNMSHPSRGCSQDGLRSTGGGGLFYCFATN